MIQRRDDNRGQLNNDGFTLVELLVAVLILAIVVTPILHSFVTAAKTNQKSKETMRATTLAENVMEEFENASVNDLLDKYNGLQTGNELDFQISGNQLGEYNADDYQIEIVLDPTPYATQNSMNVADVEAINVLHCGVFAMAENYDYNVYSHYSDVNTGANLINPSTYPLHDADWFQTHVMREIEVKFLNCGTAIDMNGEVVDRVKVMIKVQYTAPAGSVPESERIFSDTQEIFDNTTTLETFQGAYLLYTPDFYIANDVIRIQNSGNVKGTVYVLREETSNDGIFLPGYRAKIEIVENTVPGGGVIDENTQAALRLRTNLHSSLSPLSTPTRYYDLSYKVTAILLPETNDELIEKILHVQSADGRNFDNTTTGNRIYKMSVIVSKDGKTLATIEGTKLD